MIRKIRVACLIAAATFAIAADTPKGYLPPDAVDLMKILPPPPEKGEIRYETDRQVFKATRREKDSARWALATADVPSAVPEVMKDFSCAAGVTLSPTATPATYKLLLNANSDTSRATNAAKDKWKRLRPFLIDKGPVCEDTDSLAKSYDYPSGHATRGWTFGLILSDLIPNRATPILTRARAYGESRIICGAHNMSAIEAGRLSADVTIRFVQAMPAYQADLAAARAELAAARSGGTGPDAGSCSAESMLTEKSVLGGLYK
jgi:acid phosphatase (class A)